MKFKSRNARIKEYNEAYPKRIDDPSTALKEYFKSHKMDLEKAIKKAKEKILLIQEEREFESIHIVMYEYPMKTDRPRTFGGHTFSPNAAANHKYFESAVHSVVKTMKKITTPAEIEIEAYLEMPSMVPPDEVILFEAKVLNVLDYPDYDNIGKCYTDMLKDVLIIDDNIFWSGRVRKYYSVTPRVEITIRYLTKIESDYIYRKLKNRRSIREAIQSGQCEIKKIGEE